MKVVGGKLGVNSTVKIVMRNEKGWIRSFTEWVLSRLGVIKAGSVSDLKRSVSLLTKNLKRHGASCDLNNIDYTQFSQSMKARYAVLKIEENRAPIDQVAVAVVYRSLGQKAESIISKNQLQGRVSQHLSKGIAWGKVAATAAMAGAAALLVYGAYAAFPVSALAAAKGGVTKIADATASLASSVLGVKASNSSRNSTPLDSDRITSDNCCLPLNYWQSQDAANVYDSLKPADKAAHFFPEIQGEHLAMGVAGLMMIPVVKGLSKSYQERCKTQEALHRHQAVEEQIEKLTQESKGIRNKLTTAYIILFSEAKNTSAIVEKKGRKDQQVAQVTRCFEDYARKVGTNERKGLNGFDRQKAVQLAALNQTLTNELKTTPYKLLLEIKKLDKQIKALNAQL